VGEQSAEACWFRLAHKPGRKKVACDRIVDGGGEERPPHRLAAKVDELVECGPLALRSSAEVAFPCELRVPKPSCRGEECFHLRAVAADKSVRGSGGCRGLAQRLHPVCLLPFSSLSEPTGGPVARLRELRRREGIQPIGDLVHAHPADFRSPPTTMAIEFLEIEDYGLASVPE
jgi:hypothetical protein